jgi:hypothetical protein
MSLSKSFSNVLRQAQHDKISLRIESRSYSTCQSEFIEDLINVLRQVQHDKMSLRIESRSYSTCQSEFIEDLFNCASTSSAWQAVNLFIEI